MRRKFQALAAVTALAIIAGLTWVVSTTKFELREVDYSDEAVGINVIPGASSNLPFVDFILTGLGWGLAALAAGALIFTVWAVIRQVDLIRRGRPDSR